MDEERVLEESAELPKGRTRNGTQFRDNHSDHDNVSTAKSVDPPETSSQEKALVPPLLLTLHQITYMMMLRIVPLWMARSVLRTAFVLNPC